MDAWADWTDQTSPTLGTNNIAQPNNTVPARIMKEKHKDLPVQFIGWKIEVLYQFDPTGNLKPDQNGRKRKRAARCAALEALLHPVSNTPDPREERYQRDIINTSGSLIELRKRSSSLPVEAHRAHLREKDEAALDMAPSKSGSRKPRHHSNDGNTPSILEGDLNTISLNEDDYVDLYEKEGKVELAKRIRPNTGHNTKKHSSEIEVPDLTLEKSGEVAHGSVHENKDLNECKNTANEQTPKWGQYWRSPTATLGVHDTSAPPLNIKFVNAPLPCSEMKPLGGVRPVNRLSDKSNNPPSNLQRQQPKTFELNKDGGSYNPPQEENPHKRRKIDGGSRSSNMSPRDAIELDSGSPSPQRLAESSAMRSEQSYTHNDGRKRSTLGPVPEFSKIEGFTKLPKPNNRPSSAKRKQNSPTNHSRQEQQKAAFSKSRQTIPRVDNLEDPNDHISDDQDVVELPQTKRKTTVQVVISSQEINRPSYPGIARLQPARSAVNSTSSKQTPGKRSSYFLPNQEGSVSNGSVSSTSKDPNSRPNGLPPPVRASADHGMNRKSQPQHVPQGIDDSQDELTDERDWKLAQSMLSTHRSKGSSTTEQKREWAPHAVDDSSQDELQIYNTADIQPTNFKSSMKPIRQPKLLRDDLEVMQIFSQAHVWLSGEDNRRWSLQVNQLEMTLAVNGEGCPDLLMGFNSILRVIRSRDGSKIIIQKSIKDIEFARESQIFLKLGHRTQTERLIKVLESSNVNILFKDSGHIEKIFAKALEQMPSQPKFATQIEQPHDEEIELLKAKSIKRTDALFDRVQAGKGMGNGRLIDQLVSGEPPQEIRGAARTRVTRSSSGLCEFEDDDGMLIQRRTIAPKNFYSTANELQPDGHHGPRSSIRAAKQTPLYRRPQESFEETPKIERWTMVNPNWSDGWQHSIVYPPTGKNRATVDKQDIERLDEGEFLNDSLINFYLRWLEHHLLPQLANRVYFHNTYFYKTLTTGKQRSINYEAVERWTAKVDLLSYDYIVVPVNEYTHWYVAIICNAPRLLARDGDRSMKRSVSPQAGDAPVRPTESSRSPLQSSKLALVSDQEVELMKGLSLHDAFDEERDGRSSPEHGLNPVSTSLTTLSNDVAKANAINQKPKRGSNRQSPISIPNSFDKERDFEEIGPESVMLNTVTAEASARKPSTPKKGRRKYGGLTSRKHNPKEPKIITLDSLGVKHSPTCTNLRNYVVAEIKSKKGIEIPPPGALGTTATNIPQQNNHCDCGLFLLSYVEKFVENPDEFYKHAIENTNDGTQWLAASAMRNKIRDLLFTLQEHQIAEAEGLRQKKGKGKKDIKESEKPKASIPVDMVETPNTASAGPTSDPPDLAVPSKTRLHDLQQELPVQIVTHDRKRSASTEPVKPVGDTKRSRIQAQSAQIAPETRSRPEYNIPREIHELDHDSQEVDEILPILHERTQKVPTSEVRFSVEVQALDVDIQRSGMSAAACLPKSGTRSVGIDEVSSVQKSNNNPDPPHLGRTRGSAVVIQESPEKSSDQRKSHRSSENPPTTITSARNLPLAGAKAQRNKIHPRQPPFRSSVQLNGEHDEPDGRPGSSSSHSSTLDNIGMPNAARAITQSINDAEMLLDSGGSGETGGVNDVYGADTLSSPDVSLENTSPPAVRTHSHSPPKLQASHQIQNGLESHRIGSHGTRSEHRSWQQTHPGSNEVAHIAGAYGVHTRAFQ